MTLQFPSLNVSVQPTDIVYACLTVGGQAGVNIPNTSTNTKPFPIGVVDTVNHGNGEIEVNTATYPSFTPSGHYYFFSKDKRVNMSGIIGYYALVEYRNYSKKQAEVFATGMEYSISSK